MTSIIIGVIVLIGLLVLVVYAFSDKSDDDKSLLNVNIQEVKGFEEIEFGGKKYKGAVVLNYVVGKVPEYLIDWTSNISASIIIIALFLLLILTFGDILSIFGTFNTLTAWVIAGILSIIAAQLNLIKAIAVYSLALTAGLGAIAVFVSIIGVFVIFILFNFGTSSLRKALVLRRAEDTAIKAVAGGKKAASGVEVLKDIARKSEEDEK